MMVRKEREKVYKGRKGKKEDNRQDQGETRGEKRTNINRRD